jgi:hypothetical protein
LADKTIRVYDENGAALDVLAHDNGDGTYSYTSYVEPQFTTLPAIATGEVQGDAAAAQFPTLACKMVNIKARSDNVGNVYIGGAGVTKPDGVTDVTTGLELGPGEETGWIPVPNLNLLYRICDNAGDDVTYLALLA